MTNPLLLNKALKRCSASFNGDNGECQNGVTSTDQSTLIHRIQQDKLYQKISARDKYRLEKEKWWLDRILASCHNDEDVAYVVMMECLRWRVSFDVECISLLSLKDLLDRQLMFIHGQNHEGIRILWINLNRYIAGEQGFEQLFAFWIERHYMDTRGEPLVMMIDMTDTKPRNMDMNIFKFIFKMTKYYYPGSVKEILVFNSPNILSGPWKVISSWIEEGHPRIEHVDRGGIIDFIHPDYLRPELGGDDTFVFTMAEIAKCLPPTPMDDDGFVDSFSDAKNIDDFNKRSVTFDDPESPGRREPLTLVRRNSNRPPSRGPGRRNTLNGNVKLIADKRLQAPEWFTNGQISFSPKDEVLLQKIDGEVDLVDIICVKNDSTSPWMYKIKTTSPEKFRVRPSTGIVQPNSTESVRVYLQNEYRHSCAREKFLVMAIETNEVQIEKFAEIWRSTAAPKVEHKLKCKVVDNGGDNRPERRSSLISTQQEQIEQMQKELRYLANSQRLIIVVIGFVFAILFISMLYERSNYESLRTSIDALAQNAKILANAAQNQQTRAVEDEL